MQMNMEDRYSELASSEDESKPIVILCYRLFFYFKGCFR